MTRLEFLKSQAEVLRRLAESFDVPELRQSVLAIAVRCEQMVSDILRDETQAQRAAAPQDEMAS
jgi:hypothetical protein